MRIRRPEMVSVGDGTIIDDFTYISGEVEIGKYVHIAASCSLQASKSKITIKDFAGLATGVKVFASSSDFVKCSLDLPTIPNDLMYGGNYEEIIIDEFVLVGANSIILPGCHLPKGFAAGALSKLTKNIPFKSWHILLSDSTGESVRRIGVEKILKQSKAIIGKDY